MHGHDGGARSSRLRRARAKKRQRTVPQSPSLQRRLRQVERQARTHDTSAWMGMSPIESAATFLYLLQTTAGIYHATGRSIRDEWRARHAAPAQRP